MALLAVAMGVWKVVLGLKGAILRTLGERKSAHSDIIRDILQYVWQPTVASLPTYRGTTFPVLKKQLFLMLMFSLGLWLNIVIKYIATKKNCHRRHFFLLICTLSTAVYACWRGWPCYKGLIFFASDLHEFCLYIILHAIIFKWKIGGLGEQMLGKRLQIEEFPSMRHGWTVRGGENKNKWVNA